MIPAGKNGRTDMAAEKTGNVSLIRAVLLLITLVYVPVSILLSTTGMKTVDPMWFNYLIGTSSLAVFTASFMFKTVRSRLLVFAKLVFYLILSNLYYINVLNGFPLEYAVVLTFCLFFGGAFQYNLRDLILYQSLTAALSIVSISVSKLETPHYSALILVTAVTAIFSFIVYYHHLKSDKALLESEERFRQLFNTATDMIFLFDKDRHITHANEAFRKFYEVKEGESMEEKRHSVFDPRQVDLLDTEEIEVLKGAIVRSEITVNKKGENHYFDVIKAPLRDDKNHITGLFAIARDVTEKKLTDENNARLMNKLRESNDALQQFAYTASHDLKEPLRMIRNFLGLIRRRMNERGLLDGDFDDFIRFAVEGGDRMEILLDGLLRYSRIETRANPFVSTDLNETFREALMNLRIPIENSKAVIKSRKLPVVEADPVQMVQLFQNLLSNAVKYARRDVTPNIVVRSKVSNGTAKISIADNGMGIENKDFDRVFQIYQRLHSASEIPGAGVGLSICKRIVERHGGGIWIESTFGKGSTFFFTLPAVH